jgi:hypothetical protein
MTGALPGRPASLVRTLLGFTDSVGIYSGRTGVTQLKSARTEMAPSGGAITPVRMESRARALNEV